MRTWWLLRISGLRHLLRRVHRIFDNIYSRYSSYDEERGPDPPMLVSQSAGERLVRRIRKGARICDAFFLRRLNTRAEIDIRTADRVGRAIHESDATSTKEDEHDRGEMTP